MHHSIFNLDRNEIFFLSEEEEIKQTWGKWHCSGLINSFAEVDINEVNPDGLVLHTDLTLIWLSYFNILPLQDLSSF